MAQDNDELAVQVSVQITDALKALSQLQAAAKKAQNQLNSLNNTGAGGAANNIQDAANKANASISGLGNAGTKTAGLLGTAFKGIAGTFGLALGAGAIAMFVKRVIETNAQIGKLATRSGMAERNIRGLQNQFKALGYSAEEANQSIDSYAKSYADMMYGGNFGGMAESFAHLGVNIQSGLGQMKDFNDALLEAGENALRIFGGDRTAAQGYMRAYGFTTAQADLATRPNAREELKRQEQENLSNKKAAETAEKFLGVLSKVGMAFADLVLQLEDTFGIFDKLTKAVELAGKGIKLFTKGFEILAEIPKAFLKMCRDVLNDMGLGWLADKLFGKEGDNQKEDKKEEGSGFFGWVRGKFNKAVEDAEEQSRNAGNKPAKTQTKPAASNTTPEEDNTPEPPKKADTPKPAGEGSNRTAGDTAGNGGFTPTANHKPTGKFKSTLTGAEEALAALIGKGEGDYDSVNRARVNKKGDTYYQPGKMDLTNMTVAEVMQAQKNRQIFAAGRYQFIPKTLREMVQAGKIDLNAKFNEETQDKLYLTQLRQKKAVRDYLNGKGNKTSAAMGMSQIWASIGMPGSDLSYYNGVGGNKASIKSADVQLAMEKVRKERAERKAQQAQNTRNLTQNVTINGANDPNGTMQAFQKTSADLAILNSSITG